MCQCIYVSICDIVPVLLRLAIAARVTPGKIEAWIDADKVVDVATENRTISIRLEVEESKPLGIASWSTTAALRNLKLRKL